MKIELDYNGGQTSRNSFHRKHTHQATGIERELFTKRRKGMPVEGSQEMTWYHPNDKKTHATYQDALQNAVKLRLVTDEQAAPYIVT